MPSDYDLIREDNIRRRGEEFDDIGQFVSDQLYADRTHFIYELLQNAEDAGARRVEFVLEPNRLIFRHYGGRPFDSQDVEAISDILHGTKRDDQSKIGKFGIGFKSVFAFTTSPEIHSGDEHFRIEHYIRPFQAEVIALQDFETVMVFPFNHQMVGAEDIYRQIDERLLSLGARTLLFLRQISAVDYTITGRGLGMYSRTAEDIGFGKRVRLVGMAAGGVQADDQEDWLLFEKELLLPDASLSRPIQLAYRLQSDDSGVPKEIVAIPDAPLSVSFPTEQRTDLGFLIDGPYVTTSARDNVKRDDDWNRRLVLETSELVVESLRSLRDNGLLTVSALEAMPLKTPESAFAYSLGFFSPIYHGVVQALSNESLLPAMDGQFISGTTAKLSRGPVRRLLSSPQLSRLFKSNKPLSWLTDDISQDRTPDLRKYVMTALGVDEVDAEVFARLFDIRFIEEQTDNWIVSFYEFLASQEALWRKPRFRGENVPLRQKPFIRLSDGSHTRPFDDLNRPLAYLPSSRSTHFPTVRSSVVSNEAALDFLRRLGLTEPELVDEVISFILNKYPNLEDPLELPCAVTEEENLSDVRFILAVLAEALGEKKLVLEKELSNRRFLLTECLATGERRFQTGSKAYISSEALLSYFDGNPDAWFLLADLKEEDEDALLRLGVSRRVRVSRRLPDRSNYVLLANYFGQHRRGLDGFDPDAEIDGIEYVLNSMTLAKAAFVWNALLIPLSGQIRGIVESATRQDYSNARQDERFSEFGSLLDSIAWLPDRDGKYHRPSEISAEEIQESLKPSEGLFRALGVKLAVNAEALEALGLDDLDREDLLILREEKDALKEWLAEQRRTRAENPMEGTTGVASVDYQALFQELFVRPAEVETVIEPVFPGSISNPQRYRQNVAADIAQARLEEPPREARFKRIPRQVWESKGSDVRDFLQEEYQGHCQICDEMFIKRDGDPYFEGVYLVSRTGARWLDQPGNVLCLCATCTAKFEHGSVEAEDAMEQILGFLTSAEGGDNRQAVQLKLCGAAVELFFTERHFVRLQELLRQI